MRGLVGMVGIKYTTGMTVAAAAIDLAQRALGERRPSPFRAPPPGRSEDAGDPAGAAAVARAIREEMALDLADLVFRRTGLGSFGHPGRPALEACAAGAASEFGWDEARRRRELDAVETEFRRLAGRGPG